MMQPRWIAWAFALAAAAAPVGAQVKVVGDWHGPLQTPIGTMTLIITIAQDQNGTLRGEMQSPDQGPGKIPLTTISAADGRLAFTVRAAQISYEGNWVEAEQHWSGRSNVAPPPARAPPAPVAGRARVARPAACESVGAPDRGAENAALRPIASLRVRRRSRALTNARLPRASCRGDRSACRMTCSLHQPAVACGRSGGARRTGGVRRRPQAPREEGNEETPALIPDVSSRLSNQPRLTYRSGRFVQTRAIDRPRSI